MPSSWTSRTNLHRRCLIESVVPNLKADGKDFHDFVAWMVAGLNGDAAGELQHQAYDHVLRDQERRRNTFAATCGYILANPVEAGLVARPEEHPFVGAIVPGYPKWRPFDKRFWPRFWALYSKSKEPAAWVVKRPVDRNRGAPST